MSVHGLSEAAMLLDSMSYLISYPYSRFSNVVVHLYTQIAWLIAMLSVEPGQTTKININSDVLSDNQNHGY